MCVEYSTVSNTKITNNLTFSEHVSIIVLVLLQYLLNKTEANSEMCNIEYSDI
jgi:hypothetical protein